MVKEPRRPNPFTGANRVAIGQNKSQVHDSVFSRIVFPSPSRFGQSSSSSQQGPQDPSFKEVEFGGSNNSAPSNLNGPPGIARALTDRRLFRGSAALLRVLGLLPTAP